MTLTVGRGRPQSLLVCSSANAFLRGACRGGGAAARKNVPTDRVGSNDDVEPLAFLSCTDICRLHACSFRHAMTLCELGFGPTYADEVDRTSSQSDSVESESHSADSEDGLDEDREEEDHEEGNKGQYGYSDSD